MTDAEQWREIASYPNYAVSDQGRVRSNPRSWWSGNRQVNYQGMVLKGTPNDAGYLVVNLYHERKVRTYQVHRLVLAAFVGPCPDGMEGCHKNRIPADNRLENIRWDTGSGNYRDFIESGGVHWQSQKTECPRGHLLIPENLVERDLDSGRRRCQACTSANWYRRNHPWSAFVMRADEFYYELTGLEPNLSATGRSRHTVFADPRIAEHGAA